MNDIPANTLTTSRIREFGVRLGLGAAVFAKRILFGDFGVEVDQWRDEDVCGIHDLVAHDDLSERHAVELLLSVRFNRLDLSLTCTNTQEHKRFTYTTTVSFSSRYKAREIAWMPISILTLQEKFNHLYIKVSNIETFVYIGSTVLIILRSLMPTHTHNVVYIEMHSPLMSFSTQVKVMPPSLLLSLKRSRNVPGGFGLRIALSLSLLMKPIIYLAHIHTKAWFIHRSSDWCNELWILHKCTQQSRHVQKGGFAGFGAQYCTLSQ